MMAEHALVAEQADIALLGAADDRDGLAQRILAALARVTALAAHDHQPSALQEFADQSDEESDQHPEHDNRDCAAERLRKSYRKRLIEEPSESAAGDSADRAVAPPRIRSGRPSNAEANR